MNKMGEVVDGFIKLAVIIPIVGVIALIIALV